MYVTAKKCPKSIGQRALNKGHARNPTLIQQLTFSKNISKIDLWRLNFQKPFRFFFLHAKRLVSDDSYVITSFVLIAKSNSILVVAVAFLILFFHRRDLKFDVKQYSVESDWVIYIGHLDTPRELETSKGVPDIVKKKTQRLEKLIHLKSIGTLYKCLRGLKGIARIAHRVYTKNHCHIIFGLTASQSTLPTPTGEPGNIMDYVEVHF